MLSNTSLQREAPEFLDPGFSIVTPDGPVRVSSLSFHVCFLVVVVLWRYYALTVCLANGLWPKDQVALLP